MAFNDCSSLCNNPLSYCSAADAAEHQSTLCGVGGVGVSTLVLLCIFFMHGRLLAGVPQDPSARPDARQLLQHEWVQFNRRTLRGTWSKTQGFRSRAAGGPKASDAHESVNSVVARILQAEGSEDELAASRTSFEAQQAAAAAGSSMSIQQPRVVRTIDASVGPLASDTPPRLALQQDTLLTASSLTNAGSMQAAALAHAPTVPSGSGHLPSADSLTAADRQQQQPRRLGSIELAAQQAFPNGPSSPGPSPRSRLGQQQQQPGPFLQQQTSYQQQQQQHLLQQYRLQQQQEVQATGQQQQEYLPQQSSTAELGSPAGGRPPPLIYQGEQLQYGPGASGRSSPMRGQLMGPSPLGGADMESPLGNLLARIQGDQYIMPGVPGSSPITPSAAAAAGVAGPVGSQNLLAWLDDGPPAGVRHTSSFNGLATTSRGHLMDGGLFGGLGLGGGGSYLLHVPSANSLDSSHSQVGACLPARTAALHQLAVVR